MSLVAKMPPPKPRELPKNEPTQAVCFAIVDCGQHEQENRETGEVRLVPKVMYLFELDQKRTDGLPFIMGQTHTNSMHKKSNQRPWLESWNGVKFTDAEAEAGVMLDPYVGKNAYITPVYTDAKSGVRYANIGSITKIRDRDVPMVPTVKEIPKWVHDYIAKAKVPPAGYVAKTEESDMPF